MVNSYFNFNDDLKVSAPAVVRRILLPVAWLGFVSAGCAWAYIDWQWALGYIGGIVVSVFNIIFITLLAQQVLITAGKRNFVNIISILAIKLVVVYGGLAALILWKLIPTVAVVCGFSLILFVITLKAVGRVLIDSGLFGQRGPVDERESHHCDS